MSKIVIGIQGGVGSTNEKACYFFAHKRGWKNLEIKYLISTDKVLSALEKGNIDYGTFAWESSRGGLVLETQEAIKEHGYQKIDEEKFQIDHALLQLRKHRIDKSKLVRVYSHPQALKEHEPFLVKEFKNIELVEELNTAVAAKKLQNNEYSLNSVIIAPISCAKIYNLGIYLFDLPTNRGYFTTIFLVQNFKS